MSEFLSPNCQIPDILPSIIDVSDLEFVPSGEIFPLAGDTRILLNRVWLENGNKEKRQELYMWLADNFVGFRENYESYKSKRPVVVLFAQGFTVPPKYNGNSTIELYHDRILHPFTRCLEQLHISDRTIIISMVNPGHGKSRFLIPNIGGFNLEQGSTENLALAQTALLLKIRKDLNPEAVITIANSQGAAAALIALAYYRDIPKIDLLITYGPAFEDTLKTKYWVITRLARILYAAERRHPDAARLRPHIHKSLTFGMRAYRKFFPFNDSFGAEGFSQTPPDTIMPGLRSMTFDGRINLDLVLSLLTDDDKKKLVMMAGIYDSTLNSRKIRKTSALREIKTIMLPSGHDAMRVDPNLVLVPIVYAIENKVLK